MFDYNFAAVYADILKTQMLLNRFRLSEARLIVEQGIEFCRRYSVEVHLLMLFGLKAEILILLDDSNGANEAITQANLIANHQKILILLFIAPYIIAQFVISIQKLKKTIESKDNNNLSAQKKQTLQCGKDALKKLRKFAPYRTKTLRLMGDYFWLIGKQNKAFKWWDKAMKKGEALGARPDLSRTYFEIGKALTDPNCKYKEWQGLPAEEYLKKARVLFEEMDLQWDLDELDKVMA